MLPTASPVPGPRAPLPQHPVTAWDTERKIPALTHSVSHVSRCDHTPHVAHFPPARMSSHEDSLLLRPSREVSQDTQNMRSITASPISHGPSRSTSMSSLTSLSEIVDSINPHRSFFYIVMLAIIVGGLQLAWCTEFSEGTPFLLSLGVSKDTLALIWIAGPLSGSLGQPIIGILSDNSENRSGRRKPFIIGGCIATAFSLFYLSYSVDIIGVFLPSGTPADRVKAVTIPFAASGVYLLDFSISAIQAASRAYIVDNVATHQQQLANALAAIMIGGFNIIGYFLGSINLLATFPFLGDTQFKILATIASIVLVSTTTASLLYIKERDPATDVVIRAERKRNIKRLKELGIDNPTTPGGLLVSLYKQTSQSITRLSPQVKIVCLAEFFAWIGYFPMLFYTTTYVGELYKYEFYSNRDPSLPALTPDELQQLQDSSTRRGATALLLHSVSSFAVDLLLPALVQPFNHEPYADDEVALVNSGVVGDYMEKFRQKFTWWLTVRNSWYLSHLLFIVCMAATYFIRSSFAAIVLFGFLGITWGNALWAPFVLISEEMSRIKEVKARIQKESTAFTLRQAGSRRLNQSAMEKFENYEHEAGIILGIHNFFVAAPQVISSLLSSVLFRFLSKSTPGQDFTYDDSLGWVFRFGGVAAIGAYVLSLKLKTNDELLKEEETLLTPEP